MNILPLVQQWMIQENDLDLDMQFVNHEHHVLLPYKYFEYNSIKIISILTIDFHMKDIQILIYISIVLNVEHDFQLYYDVNLSFELPKGSNNHELD